MAGLFLSSLAFADSTGVKEDFFMPGMQKKFMKKFYGSDKKDILDLVKMFCYYRDMTAEEDSENDCG